jgi:hypothetical protein
VTDSDEPCAIAADVEPVELADQLGDFALAQVESLQDRPRRVVLWAGGTLAEHPGDRLAQPGEPALHRAQSAVPGLDHGNAHHAARDAVGVDGYLGPFGVIVLFFILVRLRRFLAQRPAARQRAERRRGLFSQRHQVGTAAEGERHVKGLLVVHRVEAAPGDEGEVQPVGGKHRVAVGEPAVGHVDDLAIRDPRHPDTAQRLRAGLGPGQPD